MNSYSEVTFDTTKKYIILTHGWVDGFQIDWYNKTIQEFTSHDDTIIIAVGYEEAMNCKLYVGSVLLLDALAEQVSSLVLYMRSIGVPMSNIEFVGHSLGAHIAGITGKKVYSESGYKIRRIFALDPAAPLIPPLKLNANQRLTKNDAERVVVIHTSLLGSQAVLGHVDFYPNGGTSQGECGKQYISNHLASALYFFCSINDICFNVGYQCENYNKFKAGQCYSNPNALMGYHVSDSAEGVYYLDVEC